MALQLPPIINTRGASNQPLVNAVTQAITRNQDIARQDQLLEQARQVATARTANQRIIAQADSIRNSKGTFEQKRAQFIQLAIEQGNAGEDTNEFLNTLDQATTLDELNTGLTRFSLGRKDADQLIQEAELRLKAELTESPGIKPQSPVGKLQADVNSGLITAEQAAQKAASIPSVQQNLIAAGFEKGTPEFQAKLLELIERPIGTTVNVGDPETKKELEALKLKTKQIELASKSKKLKEFTQEQTKAAQFASMMEEAEANVKSAFDKGFDPTTAQEVALGAVPGGNIARSNLSQLNKQGQEAWVRAKLRKESGAVINENEMEEEIKTFFPVFGDKGPAIEQKRRARANALAALQSAAGGALDAVKEQAAANIAAKKAPVNTADTGFTIEQLQQMTPLQRAELKRQLENQ